jgi:nucleoside-diphosphate-sugar epimerase
MGSEVKSILVLGCGWVGFPLAKRLKKEGHQVSGTTRSSGDGETFEAAGIGHFTCEVGKDVIFPEGFIESLHTLIIAYPLAARRMSEPDEYMNHVAWLKKMLFDRLSSSTQVILYSSTSVYPENQGEVDENTKIHPIGSGLIQLKYEEALNELLGNRLVILRLAGLIGPGRHPGHFFAGKVNVPNPYAPVNLVHLDDVITVTSKIIDLKLESDVCNLCSEVHPERHQFYTRMTEEIGLVKPLFDWTQENVKMPKIVSSDKIRRLLKIRFQNPYSCE